MFSRVTRFFVLILLLGLLAALSSGTSQATFQDDLAIGARPAAMGGSFVAIANDVNAIFLNPSGLSQLERREVTTTYTQLFPGIKDDNISQGLVGFGLPLGSMGTVGVGWQGLFSDNFNENALTLSYGRPVFSGISAGLNAKLLMWKATLDQGDKSSSMNASSIGIDIGALWRAPWKLKFGAFVRNLNQPNIASDKNLDGKLPVETHLGAAYDFRSVNLSAEYVIRSDNKEIYFGLEREFASGISIRGGVTSLTDQGTLGQAAGGLGYNIKSLKFDYSYIYFPQLVDTKGGHRVSLGYRF